MPTSGFQPKGFTQSPSCGPVPQANSSGLTDIVAIANADNRSAPAQEGVSATCTLFFDKILGESFSIYYMLSGNKNVTPLGSPEEQVDPIPEGLECEGEIHALKSGPPVEKPPTVLANWWDAYPIAKSSAPIMTAEEIVALKKDPASSAEFAVIDTRRNDHAVCIFSLPLRF